MGRVNLPYVHHYRDRQGNWRTYFRHPQLRRVLPDPKSEDFRPEYNACLTQVGKTPAPGHADERSLDWLVRAYQASPEFKKLAPRTRDDYAKILGVVVEHTMPKSGRRVGAQPYKAFTRGRIMETIRDPLAATTRRADYAVAVVSAMYGWAVKRELVAANPCKGIERLHEAEGWRAWTMAEVETFAAGCTDWEWLVFVLALYTGQRAGDLASLTWFQYDGEAFRIRQSKRGAVLVIAAHPVLQAALAEQTRTDGTILTGRAGRKLLADTLSSRFRQGLERIGLRGCTLHGLRATQQVLLAEAGGNNRLLMSMSGHTTMAMVAKYTAGAEQARLSRDAAAMLPVVARSRRGL